MLLYLVIEEQLYHEDIGEYTSYGIQGIYATYGVYKEVAFVSDVVCDRKKTAEIAALCTRLQLSPIHLIDVVEDMIG